MVRRSVSRIRQRRKTRTQNLLRLDALRSRNEDDRRAGRKTQRRSRFRHQRRFADIHRYEDDIPTPYESERIGAVQAALSLLAAHLFEYALRIARKPEGHPDAARAQRRHDDNPHLQQRRPFLLQASRRQTRLKIPLRRQLKELLLNKIPHHKVGDFICNSSSPQAKHYSPISPKGFPLQHFLPMMIIFNRKYVTYKVNNSSMTCCALVLNVNPSYVIFNFPQNSRS